MKRLEKEWEKRLLVQRKKQETRAAERRLARQERRRARKDEDLEPEGDKSDNPCGEGAKDPEEDGDDTDSDTHTHTDIDKEELDPQEASLFVYVCTHSAEITKGKGVAGTYLVTSDTSWKSKEELARTAIPLETFKGAIARIQVRHKVVFLDVVHAAKEVEGFRTRHLYPPQDLYNNMARLSGAVVVGSCRIGGIREVDLDLLREKVEATWVVGQTKKGVGCCVDRNHAERTSNASDVGSDDEVPLERSADDGGGSTEASASWEDSNSARSSGSRRGDRGSSRSDRSSDGTDRNCGNVSEECDVDLRKRKAIGSGCKHGGDGDWIRGRHNAGRKSAVRGNPIPLVAAVDGNEIKGIARWTDWKRSLSGIMSIAGVERALIRDDAIRALYGEDSSIIGRAVRDAFSGECIDEGFGAKCVLIVHLFSFIVRQLVSFKQSTPRAKAREDGARDDTDGYTESRREGAAAKVEAEKAPVVRGQALRWRKLEDETNTRVSRSKEREATQAPVIEGLSVSAIVQATVCAPPIPPPPPEVPLAIKVTRDSVRLVWSDVANFTGAPTISYELEQRGNLRNNRTWTPVFPSWYPAVASQTLRVSHRVPGIGLQYRVCPRNCGGCTAGARLVLERMRRYPLSLLVQESGFRQLNAEFNNDGGIRRASLAQEVATIVADAMAVFSQVRGIQALGLLLLGWATREKSGGGPMPENLLERCLGLMTTAENLHSMDVAVKGNVSWARSGLNSVRKGTATLYSASIEDSREERWPRQRTRDSFL